MCILGYDENKQIDRFWQEVDTVFYSLEDLKNVSQPIKLESSRIFAYRFDVFLSIFIPRFSMLLGFLVSVMPIMLWS